MGQCKTARRFQCAAKEIVALTAGTKHNGLMGFSFLHTFKLALIALSLCVMSLITPGALAQEEGEAVVVEPPPPLYEAQLLRLSEILGSLHFLHIVCEDEKNAAAWREEMGSLLASEQLGEKRQAQYVGRFNHGFETFNAVYRSCTPSAREAIALYLEEGAQIAADVKLRYGQ